MVSRLITGTLSKAALALITVEGIGVAFSAGIIRDWPEQYASVHRTRPNSFVLRG